MQPLWRNPHFQFKSVQLKIRQEVASGCHKSAAKGALYFWPDNAIPQVIRANLGIFLRKCSINKVQNNPIDAI